MVCGMMGVERTVAGMEFREKLRKLRLERGLSQQELADGIFVSRSAVAKWENGLGLPSESSREALAAFFGVPAADLRTEEPEAVILEKNRKLRRRTVSASTVTAILLVVLVCLNSWQSRGSARLRESMGQMDLRMEMEFEGARVLLGQEFREGTYTPLLARELEQLQTAALYGYYFDGFSGGDAVWCPLSQALGELNDSAIFALLTEEDCGAIADLLESHSYRNDPELTEADAAPILDRVEEVLAEYHAGG